MKKTALIPAVIVGLIGIAFASTAMFPNTQEFPSLPIQPGTIGGAITQLFNADGSAKNTQKLNGVTASGYLQNQNCNQSDPQHNVWVGVDANGKAICGHRITPLASIGKFSEIHGNILVKKGGVGAGTLANTTEDLLPGDIIVTNSATGTIQFASDLSILRLDANTTVALSTGENTSGQSVAQAILSDGRLWGRIITSTGVNLGGGGLVAGVRGTSVSVEKSTTGLYTLSVIDSQKTGNEEDPAAYITNTSNPDIRISMPKENQIVYLSGGIVPSLGIYQSPPSFVQNTTTAPKISLLTGSLWIRENTKADIEYLYDNSIAGNFKQAASNELDITKPHTTDIRTLTALCNQDQTYWESLIGVDYYSEKCQNANIIAYADYTNTPNNDANLYKNDAGKISPTIGTTSLYSQDANGITIKTTGQYLGYTDTSLLQNLAGKTITLTLNAPVGTQISGTKFYIADFGGNIKILKNGNAYQCMWSTSSSFPCGDDLYISSDDKQLTIKIPATPTQVIIGNTAFTETDGTITYTKPIGTTIRSITIQ